MANRKSASRSDRRSFRCPVSAQPALGLRSHLLTFKQGEKHGNEGRTVSNFGVPPASRVFERSNEPSGRLQDYDLIEFSDDWRAIEESLNHFHDPVPDLDDMKADAGDTLNGFNGKTDKGHGVHEPYDYLQTVVELLRSLRDARVKTRGLE